MACKSDQRKKLERLCRYITRPAIAERQAKSDYFLEDRAGFLEQLHRELDNFERLCDRQGVKGAVRLNVLSDIQWEKLGVPQAHPELLFVDYTKLSARLGKTPSNYHLIFSYSGASEYRKHVKRALKTEAPISVVFRGEMPAEFLGRPYTKPPGPLNLFQYLCSYPPDTSKYIFKNKRA